MKKLSIKDRFMKYVLLPNNPNDCWVWIGHKLPAGYGHIKINGKTCKTHRVSFELFVGPIPKGMLVCHSCDNPSCVNPHHLWLGTHQDNSTDMKNKNRQSHTKGEKHGNHKFTESDVYKIRELIEQGYTNTEIAELFKVRPSSICKIKTKTRWGWLE